MDSRRADLTISLSSSAVEDFALLEVASTIRDLDPEGTRISHVFRSTFDQLYDGQHTGRYAVDQLMKTEKSHFGSLIEINLQRELKLPDGTVLDYSIAGHEVDCKYSHTGAWMLPIESFDEIVLVAQADDRASKWSIGLVRVTEENRRTSENRDRKTGLNRVGRDRILWLFKDCPMQPNALLQLPPETVTQIMSGRSGQARVNDLFRYAQNRRLSRNIVATVAQQDDFMKRVRYNGGARSHLQDEGILILSGDYFIQRRIAESFAVAIPEPGEFVSFRVVPTHDPNGVSIEGSNWRLAQPDESTTAPAPVVR